MFKHKQAYLTTDPSWLHIHIMLAWETTINILNYLVIHKYFTLNARREELRVLNDHAIYFRRELCSTAGYYYQEGQCQRWNLYLSAHLNNKIVYDCSF